MTRERIVIQIQRARQAPFRGSKETDVAGLFVCEANGAVRPREAGQCARRQSRKPGDQGIQGRLEMARKPPVIPFLLMTWSPLKRDCYCGRELIPHLGIDTVSSTKSSDARLLLSEKIIVITVG